MLKPSPPIVGIALTTVVLMLVAASLQAGPEKLEPVLRTVDAAGGVTVSYAPDRGFRVAGRDAEAAIDTASPRLGLLPVFRNGKLAAVATITYEPRKAEEPAQWPALVRVADSKAQHIATPLHVTFRPVFEKALLRGFEIATIASRKGASRKGAEEGGAVTPAGKEDQAVESSKVVLELPKKRALRQWYGVLLTPVLDREGKALGGFDVALVSTARKARKAR